MCCRTFQKNFPIKAKTEDLLIVMDDEDFETEELGWSSNPSEEEIRLRVVLEEYDIDIYD